MSAICSGRKLCLLKHCLLNKHSWRDTLKQKATSAFAYKMYGGSKRELFLKFYNMQTIIVIHSNYMLESHHKHWINKYWTIAHRINTDRLLLAFDLNMSINQSIYKLVLCVFLINDTLFNIYCWFINIELTANSTITYA